MALRSTPRSVYLFAALLALATCLAWSNSFNGPFVLDDPGNIADNPSLRDLTKLGTVLSPPSSTGVGGRPFLNFTYTLNYAIGGLEVRGYHVGNLLIHVLAALTLFGLVRHTLAHLAAPSPTSAPLSSPSPSSQSPASSPPTSPSRANASSAPPPPSLLLTLSELSLPLAACAAALWALHPLQTQSVTYLSQRAESLMGLFYFLTLYCAARAFHAPRPLLWSCAAVLSCLLGLTTKEVMVTAPLLVLLYDRTFCSGSFLAALRSRVWFYFALACTWVILLPLSADITTRGVGTDHGVSSYTYLLTECRAITDYLRLMVWPHPLSFDYGSAVARTLGAVLPQAVLLLILLTATIFALVRRPLLGFFGAWFFVILAPTSSFIPITFSPEAESRVYLPLAAFAVALPIVAASWLGRRGLFAFPILVLVLGFITWQRNNVYRTDLGLWADTAEKQPASATAHYNLGLMLSRVGRVNEAIDEWNTTLRLDPAFAAAHNNLANGLASLGRVAEAAPHYEAAIRSLPDASIVRSNYGVTLLRLGRVQAAGDQLRLAIKQNPTNASAYNNLGLYLKRTGPVSEAIAAYEAALRLEPDFIDAHHNLGFLLAENGRVDEGVAHLQAVARLLPSQPAARLDIARALLNARQPAAARPYIEAVLHVLPDSPEAWLLYGNCQAFLGDFPGAGATFEKVLRLSPNNPDALENLSRVRERLNRR